MQKSRNPINQKQQQPRTNLFLSIFKVYFKTQTQKPNEKTTKYC
jgi:hypothetical protein